MNKDRRAQIEVALELMGEIGRQLLLFAKAMSRLIDLDGRNALRSDQKEKLDGLDAFSESDISGDALRRTLLRKRKLG